MGASAPPDRRVSRKRPLQPRRPPRQQRSERRVREILDVTARVLEEGGPDRLTTNRVAAELGISVGTLYHYFPNKHAILHALGAKWLDAWQEAFEEIEALSHSRPSLEKFIDGAVNRMLEVYVHQRGVLHLVQTMFTIPELRRLDTRSDEMAIERLRGILRRLKVRGSTRELERRARIYLKLTNSLLLEVVKQEGTDARRSLSDLKMMLLRELAG